MTGETAPDPIDVQVGLNLRASRKGRGISQTVLGKKLGITFQQVQKYERGTNRVSASMLVKAAKVLNVSASSLLPANDEEMPPAALNLARASLRGADELIHLYAITPIRLRRAILRLAKVFAYEVTDLDDEDEGL